MSSKRPRANSTPPRALSPIVKIIIPVPSNPVLFSIIEPLSAESLSLVDEPSYVAIPRPRPTHLELPGHSEIKKDQVETTKACMERRLKYKYSKSGQILNRPPTGQQGKRFGYNQVGEYQTRRAHARLRRLGAQNGRRSKSEDGNAFEMTELYTRNSSLLGRSISPSNIRRLSVHSPTPTLSLSAPSEPLPRFQRHPRHGWQFPYTYEHELQGPAASTRSQTPSRRCSQEIRSSSRRSSHSTLSGGNSSGRNSRMSEQRTSLQNVTESELTYNSENMRSSLQAYSDSIDKLWSLDPSSGSGCWFPGCLSATSRLLRNLLNRVLPRCMQMKVSESTDSSPSIGPQSY